MRIESTEAGVPVPSVKPAHKDDPQKAVEAAQQFESLLIGQMLKQMRSSGSEGWMGTGDDQAGESAMELAEEQLAHSLSAQGGLGLAKLIADGLNAAPRHKAKAGRSPKL